MKLNFLKEVGLSGLSNEPSVRLFIAKGSSGQSLNPRKEADRKDKVFRAGRFSKKLDFSIGYITLKILNFETVQTTLSSL